jgi:hypothetical protein
LSGRPTPLGCTQLIAHVDYRAAIAVTGLATCALLRRSRDRAGRSDTVSGFEQVGPAGDVIMSAAAG